MMLVSTELSWSLNPGDGSQLTTNVERFVNSKSRVAFLRVLNSTISVSLASSKISRKTYNIVAKPANIWKIKVSTPSNWIIFVFFPNSQQVTDETVI